MSSIRLRYAGRSARAAQVSPLADFHDRTIVRILSEAAYVYFRDHGEPHPDAPTSPTIESAIKNFDGKDDGINRVHSAYTIQFSDSHRPPSARFLRYAEELFETGQVGEGAVPHRGNLPYPGMLAVVKKVTPGELAAAAVQYITANGEEHPAAPKTPTIQEAIRGFDGYDESINRIRAAYRDYFSRKAAPVKFREYTESEIRNGNIRQRP